MARLLGGKPKDITMAMSIVYQFVMQELPDYICASFLPSVVSKKSGKKLECDMLLFIPHMGVYILDIRSVVGFRLQEGQFHYVYADGRTIRCSSTKRADRLGEQRMMVREYLKEMFNISPLVYELECFPFLEMGKLDPMQMPPEFDPDHVLTVEDFRGGLGFLYKLIGCSIYMQKKVGMGYFEDLTDKDAHDLFYFWETGVWGAKRPDRPPFVFLSYNQNNAEISKDVQMALEDRGVYVWRAPKDVPLGEHYFPEEMRAIEESDAFLLLLSIPAQNSAEVRKEFDKAMELGKPILPIWVENVPDSEISPYYKENLKKFQYRIMPKLSEEIVEEIATTVRGIAAERKGETEDSEGL